MRKPSQTTIALIEAFDCSGDDLAAKSRELSLMLLEQSEYPFSRRQFTPGHITCTAAVLDPSRQLCEYSLRAEAHGFFRQAGNGNLIHIPAIRSETATG